MIELALAAIALSWLVMLAAMAFFYLKIDHEQHEITRIKEKIDFNEKSIRKISGFFVAIKNELNAL
jgi:hypothetical protein